MKSTLEPAGPLLVPVDESGTAVGMPEDAAPTRVVESMPEAYYVRQEELYAKARRRKAGPAAHQALARHESLSRQEWLDQWAAELRQPPGRGRWIVTAERLPGRETVYLCKSPTQGTRMLPAAHSMAHRYGNRTYAEAEKRRYATGGSVVMGSVIRELSVIPSKRRRCEVCRAPITAETGGAL